MDYIHSDIRGPLFRESQKMMSSGIDVLRLNTGNPANFGFEMPISVKEALLSGVDKAVAYCDPQGMPEAREAIRAYHLKRGIENVEIDDIFIGNGVSELVNMAISSLVNDGDEILVPCPCYTLWSNSIYLAGGKPVYYACDEREGWNPDLSDLERKITPKTRAIVIINPNNPTGAVYPREILEGIVALARKHKLILFSDEIYDRLVMDGVEHIPTASLAPDLLCITMNGLSKSHIICGFRCGWMLISGDKKSAADYLSGLYQLAAMRLCSNALTQLVIPAALADEESTKKLLLPGGRLYEQREAALREIEKIEGLSCVKNKAAFYIFPKIDIERFGITDDKKFALDLLHEKHILIVPGSGFDYPDQAHFRVVMLPDSDAIAKAISDIGDFLHKR